MNKAEFIESVVKSGKYDTKAEATKAYDAFVSSLSDRVVRLPELGTFQMKTRKARMGRNPQTGKAIKIAAKKVVTFKAGSGLSSIL
jgi:DNA-binding protein HU-beta